MKNEERSRQDVESQKEIKSLKKNVARLTNLLEQELKEKSVEALVTQLAVTTLPITTTHFHRYNLGSSGTPSIKSRLKYYDIKKMLEI
jgi:ribosomal protein L29